MAVDAVYRIAQGYRLQHGIVLILLCILQEYHIRRDGDRRLVNTRLKFRVALCCQGRIKLLLCIADNNAAVLVSLLHVHAHFDIGIGDRRGLYSRVVIDQRTVYVSVIAHRVAVECFWIDAGDHVPEVNFFGHTILGNVFPVPQLHAIVAAGTLVDNHCEIVVDDFAAPSVQKAVILPIVQGLNQVLVLIIGCCRHKDIGLAGILAVRGCHGVQRLLPGGVRRPYVCQEAVAHRIHEDGLHCGGDSGIALFLLFDPEKLVPVEGRHLHNSLVDNIFPPAFRIKRVGE